MPSLHVCGSWQGDTDVQSFLRHAVMRSATAHMLLHSRQCLMSARAGQGRGRRYVAGPRRWQVPTTGVLTTVLFAA